MINSKFTIVTFYQFKQIKDLVLLKSRISDFCKFNKIKGTIIIAEEGINGTIAGMENSIKNFELEIKKPGFENFQFEMQIIPGEQEIIDALMRPASRYR